MADTKPAATFPTAGKDAAHTHDDKFGHSHHHKEEKFGAAEATAVVESVMTFETKQPDERDVAKAVEDQEAANAANGIESGDGG